MVYRAKITFIQWFVESHYNVNDLTFVSDINDVYVEVKNEEEAELLEEMNRAQRNFLNAQSKWYTNRNKQKENNE